MSLIFLIISHLYYDISFLILISCVIILLTRANSCAAFESLVEYKSQALAKKFPTTNKLATPIKTPQNACYQHHTFHRVTTKHIYPNLHLLVLPAHTLHHYSQNPDLDPIYRSPSEKFPRRRKKKPPHAVPFHFRSDARAREGQHRESSRDRARPPPPAASRTGVPFPLVQARQYSCIREDIAAPTFGGGEAGVPRDDALPRENSRAAGLLPLIGFAPRARGCCCR